MIDLALKNWDSNCLYSEVESVILEESLEQTQFHHQRGDALNLVEVDFLRYTTQTTSQVREQFVLTFKTSEPVTAGSGDYARARGKRPRGTEYRVGIHHLPKLTPNVVPAGYLPENLDEVAFTRSLVLWDYRIASKSLFEVQKQSTAIPRVLVDIIEHIQGVEMLVLAAPNEDANAPVTRQIFHQQSTILHSVHSTDSAHGGRMIFVKELWSQDSNTFSDGLIFIRVTSLTNTDEVDVSKQRIENFVADIEEAPVVHGKIEHLAPGSLLVCNVTPFRIDAPLNNVPLSKGVFSSIYGLNALQTVRMYRT
ncbi:hypothetical protein C8R43DRAFT_948760 [Mycena crocata]|nr:hypothetical protein C8R43DRAFT_948760 [Mycena crocata]